MLTCKRSLSQFLAALLLCQFALSSALAEDNSDGQMTKEEFVQSLHPKSGTITLPGGIATLQLSDKFQYIDPKAAETLLVDGWGNPPGNETLGMVIPTDINPVDREGWGVVITYDEDGYVKDSDADTLDYGKLLKQMQKQTADENEQREKQGYPAMTLVGWAETPTYDKQNHKFYWAKEYSSAGSQVDSLNYNIRVLGRKGVLVLNAVAGMDQLGMIKNEMPTLLAETEFNSGSRYQDFDSKTDRVAEYGLAALLVGGVGVAAKAGLFAKLFAMLLALKKFVVIGAVAIGAFIKKLFGKKSN